MEQFSTEEQQAEALRRWLKTNGPSILIGIGLGLGLMFAINRWQAWQLSSAEKASTQYASFQQALAQHDLAQVLAQSKRLRENDADSAYAVFAALNAAKQALAATPANSDAAELELRWVAEHAGVDGLQQIGRLRLTRVLLDKGDTTAAQAQLNRSQHDSAFTALQAEIEGDIAVANGELQRAREAYTLALAGQGNAPMLRIKLENLGVNPDS